MAAPSTTCCPWPVRVEKSNRPSTRDSGPVPARRFWARGSRKFVTEIQADCRTLEHFGLAIDQSRQFARRVDLQKFRGFMLPLREIDGNDFIFRAALIKHPLGDRRAALRIVVKLHRITSIKMAVRQERIIEVCERNLLKSTHR